MSGVDGSTGRYTTEAIVVEYDPALVNQTSLVERQIESVTARMEKWMDRVFYGIDGIKEYPYLIPNTTDTICLRYYPLKALSASTTVKERGVVLEEDVDYRRDIENGFLLRIAGNGQRRLWGIANVEVEYDSVQQDVPQDIVVACTWQVIAELHRQDQRLVGVASRDDAASVSLDFEPDGWLGMVKQTMRAHRRRA